jgi:glucosamine-phosphate N-acetyltransferase
LVIIRQIEYNDIDKGFLEVLDNLYATSIDSKEYAKEILQNIKSNPLHKTEDYDNNKIVGTTTLLVEPKFINKGMRIGYIEDVSVRKAYEGLGIGSRLVNYVTTDAISVEHCKKVLLYCSESTRPFYENWDTN